MFRAVGMFVQNLTVLHHSRKTLMVVIFDRVMQKIYWSLLPNLRRPFLTIQCLNGMNDGSWHRAKSVQ
ncbi:hypothetical protein GS399_13190 [Pedobacter sp. HMF7647]|uniref:Uncharacterized protein n=1 Tax=Hufsiella arboris TaxID=2695275 RepID=A0A7K1YC37_9SPHI|nr:hypothetical protein [Hufsiella arboris]MXV51931.1 hypothetical protein [Hufsiella arboris]